MEGLFSGGLIFERAYFWEGLLSEFYGILGQHLNFFISSSSLHVFFLIYFCFVFFFVLEDIKAVLHEAISLATFLATKVALPVARKISRVTPHFCNLQYDKMLRCKLQKKYNYPQLYATLRDMLLFVTCPSQPVAQFC